jgi:hypothetical protein
MLDVFDSDQKSILPSTYNAPTSIATAVTEILETFGLVELVFEPVIVLCRGCLLYGRSPPVREFHARFEQAWCQFDFSPCESAKSLGFGRSLSATFSSAGKASIHESDRVTPMTDFILDFV